MSENKYKDLEDLAKDIRKKTIDSIGFLGVGHIGGAMSIADLLTILYYRKMHVDPSNPKMEDRDKLVLSKGHAGPALYSTLAQKGFFPEQWLRTLNVGGTNLPSHCDMNRTPGIDMTTGSLGQGLSSAIGLALAMRLDKSERNVFAIIGDGESQEGQNWEAAMTASQFRLNKLIAFTDYNKMQIDGYTSEIMSIDDPEAKWKAFGWNTDRVNGHSFAELDAAIDRARESKDKPTMIIMDTIKGKGCSFAEGVITNHNMAFTYEQAKEAIEALG
ncbi:MAG: transketolase [Spirochaetales bacterium]|nr:transketolase [Spirochaetales bacterium]